MKVLQIIIGLVIGAAADSILIFQRLLIYTEATKQPLIGGGVVGLIVGIILAFLVPVRITAVISAGILAVFGIALFNNLVQGELSFSGRGFVLYILAFVINSALFFLGTALYEILRRSSNSLKE